MPDERAVEGAAPDRPGVLAPPPLIFALFALAGAGVGRLLPGSLGIGPAPRKGVALALFALGAGLALWALVEMRRFRTSPEPWKPSTAIVDSGPFAFSRNPIYLAMALLHLSAAFAFDSAWIALALAPALGILTWGVILREERYLERKFGDVYRGYRARVRRWL